MRRSLILLLVVVAFAAATRTVQAADFVWNGAVSITEMAPQSGIFSHIDMAHRGQIIGSWFSTAGILPILVGSDDLSYVAYGDFPGITKIQKVVLTPDGGATQWPASQIVGKGWQVNIPFGTRTVTTQEVKDVKVRGNRTEKVICEERKTIIGLEPGGYALEWGVWSRDKKNRLMLIIIPICYSSTRVSSAANHVMVQRQQVDIGRLNEFALQIYLREHGFQPATDGLSPAVMAAQQMGQPQPQPASAMTPQPQPQPKTVKVETTVKVDGVVRAEVTTKVTLVFWKGSARQTFKDQIMVQDCFHEDQIVEIWRNGQRVGAAEVGSCRPDLGIVEIHIFRGGFLVAGDKLVIAEEATQ